ncbi:MAG: hypothetical protein CME62_07490 [Halobacteriovoraceae bacterium]|nr:hypothetical protein [Halobacteriovoraceae bacterium]|tara:strand:- start:13943 stop:15211 length:1269 start_codon:yes stop_codon:yes gene_type:complete
MKERSLLSELNLTTTKILRSIIIPFFVILFVFLLSLSVFFIYQTSEVIKNNYSKNIKYWLIVGDTFQIQRAIKNFNNDNEDWKMTLKYLGYSYPEESPWKTSLYISIDKMIDVQDRPATLTLSTKYPFAVVVSMSSVLIILLALIFLPLKKSVNNIINEFKGPLDIFVERIATATNYNNKLKNDYKFKELNKINDSLIEMSSRIEKQQREIEDIEKDAYKTDVIKEISHDLRSPIDVQKMLFEGASDKLDEEEQALFSETITRLEKIIDRVLLSHRDGLLPYNTKLINNLVDLKLKEKKLIGVKVSVDITEETLMLNKDRFESSLSNIINNSLEADSKRITIVGKKLGSEYVIIIQDDGHGMSSELLKNVGQKGFTFGKVHGNGLGLYSLKRSIEGMGGTVIINSKQYHGTSIEIHLPLFRS